MSYYMQNGGITQAAAGLGQTTGAWRDGVFGEDWAPQGAPFTREGSFRDGIFGPALGADANVLDLNDPNAMKEVKALLAFWQPEPTIPAAWFTDPAWDAKAESKYMAYASKQPAQTITMVNGHAVPNAAGIFGLVMGYASSLSPGNEVEGEAQAKAQLPIVGAFADAYDANPASASVVAPKNFGASGLTKAGMSTKTLAGIGVGIAVVAVAYLALRKKK